MTNEERELAIRSALENQDLFELSSVTNVNYRPHPYCITPKHIEHCNVYLDDNSIREAEKHGAKCGMYVSRTGEWSNRHKTGWQRCTVPYDQHTSDRVCFLRMLRHGNKEEAQKILKDLVDTVGEDIVDGFSFVETEQKYRIS